MKFYRKKSESEKRQERRLRQRQRYEDNNWKINPTAPTPFEDWDDEAKSDTEEISEVIAEQPGLELWYRQDASRSPVPITTEDLALARYAVDKVGRSGITYEQLQFCFQRWSISCHRSKAARLFKLLKKLGLIVQTGKHIKGLRGSQYERPKDPPPDDKSTDDWLASLIRSQGF